MVSLTFSSGIIDLSAPARPSDSRRIPDPGVPLSSYVSTVGALSPGQVWRTQPSVRKVVSFIARNTAVVSWKGYQRVADDDRQRRSGGLVERTLRKPRHRVTAYKLLERLAIDKCLYDRWGVALIDGELQRIPPRLLVIEGDAMEGYSRIGVSTPQGILDLEHIPVAFGDGWSEFGPGGISPLVTLSAILREQRHAVEWRDALWDRSPRPAGIIKRPKEAPKWSADARKQWITGWQSFRDNMAGTPIFEDGMEYEDLRSTMNPKDALDIEGRQLTDAEVASAFHIAPELVGARQGTFSNVTAFRQMLYGPALGPLLTEFEQAFNDEIVPALADTDDEYAELDRQTAINGDFLEQARILSTAVGGPFMTRNEGRSRIGLSSIEGGDELIVPKAVTEGGQASSQDGGDGRPPGTPNEEGVTE